MDKLRIGLSILFSICINVIVKLIIVWIENTIKQCFINNYEKVIKILSIFYPIFSIVFIFTMPKIYPAFIFEEYQYFLNIIFYAAIILAIYHWFFKPIINKFADIIKNYQIKNGGNNNV